MEHYYTNIEKTFNDATPNEISLGSSWYKDANQFATNLSARYHASLPVVCSVVAAISPNCSWDVNKRDAERLLLANHLGEDLDSISLATFSKNKDKAINILRTGDTSFLSGSKVTAFADNMLNPNTSNRITIDRHCFSMCNRVAYQPTKVPKITPSKHKAITDAFCRLSGETGYRPLELQAITWLTWKRQKESFGK